MDSDVAKMHKQVVVVFSEPFDAPTEEEYQRDFACKVHAVFDDVHAAAKYASVMQCRDRTRFYGWSKVEPAEEI